MVALPALVLAAAGWASTDPRVPQGRAIYAQACAECHGDDGRGNPEWESEVRPVSSPTAGPRPSPPSSRVSIVRRGGQAHGLSSVMPGFEEAYTPEETAAVVAYLRTFCPTADAYPPGDLNFRLLKTGKAFPEAEWVDPTLGQLVRVVAGGRARDRLREPPGSALPGEIEAPFRYASPAGEENGVGDVLLAGKHVLHFDLARRQILSAGLGVSLPVGRRRARPRIRRLDVRPVPELRQGLGPDHAQARVSGEVSSQPEEAPHRVAYAAALSHALGPHRTAWVPALELTGEIETSTAITATRPGRDLQGPDAPRPRDRRGGSPSAAASNVRSRTSRDVSALGLRRRALLEGMVASRATATPVCRRANPSSSSAGQPCGLRMRRARGAASATQAPMATPR